MHRSVHVRFPDEQLLAIDKYRRTRADHIPTTQEAIRDLIAEALAARQAEAEVGDKAAA
jgi:hypothetical protein